ncbi:MAG: ABC transporter permease [Desulfobacterales bacterium]|jgi:peptide/nickel transport system permease protein
MPVNAAKAHPGWTLWVAVLWLAFVAVSAATASWWAVPAFDSIDWNNPSAAPGTRVDNAVLQNADEADKAPYVYRLGTDTMGRDVTSRLIYGARVSLLVGLFAPIIGFVLGGILGCLAGYFRGRLDSVIVAAMDVILAFPGIVLLLALTFYLGPCLRNLVFALGFLTIPAFSRVARAKTLTLCDLEFVQAARLTGAGHFSILAREIIPNVIAPLTAYALLIVSFMIMAEGALSFLGLGVPAPIPSWGGMIAEGREVLEEAPHVSMIPAAVMFLTVISFNLIGDNLRSLAEKRTSQL